MEDRVPVTILTGFLGSGKTTLMNHILTACHGKKIAIIENEFGEAAIDDALLAKNSRFASGEEMIEVLNGCICCTVRSDLIDVVRKLASRSKAGELRLDAIIIETTGMADPAPVAQTFLMEDEMRAFTYLDGIVTLVDAKHIEQHLDDLKPEGTVNEAAAQVGFADRLLLNKMDLVSAADVERVEARLRGINGYAPIQRCTRSDVSVDQVLNIKGFDLQRTLATLPGFLDKAAAAPTKHDGSVKSVSLNQSAARHFRKVRGGELDLFLVREWLDELLKSRGSDLFRVKGVLALKHADAKYVFQAVHMSLTATFDEAWAEDEPRVSKLVFIGKGLDEAELAASFNRCLATQENYDARAARLRFAVGDAVDFNAGGDDGWVGATVTRHLVRDEHMDAGMVAPYEIQRLDMPPGWTTWVELDNDVCIRKRGSAPPAGSTTDAQSHAPHGAHDHSHDHAHGGGGAHEHRDVGGIAEALQRAALDAVEAELHLNGRTAAPEGATGAQTETGAVEKPTPESYGVVGAPPAAPAAGALECTPDQSEQQRLHANQLFGTGRFDDAVIAYTRALAALADDGSGLTLPLSSLKAESRRADAARILANRAACHLKLQQPVQALGDATQAIEMDASYDKAHYRRAHALQALGRQREAQEAMKKAKELNATAPSSRGSAATKSAAVGAGRSVAGADGGASAVRGTAAADGAASEEDRRVAQIIEGLKPTLAGSETRRVLVDELFTLLSRVSADGDKALQSATARAFADAKGPQVLYEIENSMRGNWYADAKNGTMSKITKIFQLKGAVCKSAINWRNSSHRQQAAAAMCTPGAECCWANPNETTRAA